ncbi:retrovirus-related pol polyprotein from transposon TNT 1-94 [Tanacetum coccineum]
MVDDDLDEEEAIKVAEKKILENVIEDETLEIDEVVNIKESRNHPLENNVNEALTDESWIIAMQEELNQFIANDVWELVAQGYNQQEGIDYDETYAPVARLESNRILLDYACELYFKLFQIDVKSAFLNSFINEEVYVAQPPGFIDFEKPDHVYKLKKALYGLKQSPKACYDRLKASLIKHEYKMGMIDNTLFTKKKTISLIIVQICVDDIIFDSTCQDMCDEFAKIMHDEFEMSMMGELNFFLRLQIKQMKDGIFFNQSKYIKEMLKKFGLEDSKPMKTPMSSDTKLTKYEECTTYLGLWYPKGTGIETVVYADSDHAGDYVNRKSTSGISTFVGCCLTSWFSKKQTALAISTTEAEYISAEKACQQALWMKRAHIDYDVQLDDVPIIAKRMEFVTKQARLILPYGMILNRLFKYVMSESPELFNESYVLYDRVMYPFAAQQERKTRKDYGTKRGRHTTSSSYAFDQPSSSYLNDDDDGNNEETSRASNPSPTRFVNSLTNEVPRVFENPPNVEPDMEQFYTH